MITAQEYRTMGKKKSKYHNEFTVVDDIKFRSKKEAEYYKNLKFLKEHGEVRDFSMQPRFPYFITYSRITTTSMREYEQNDLVKKGCYVADFCVIYKDGRLEYQDTKGYETAKFKRDKQIVKTLYGVDIKII